MVSDAVVFGDLDGFAGPRGGAAVAFGWRVCHGDGDDFVVEEAVSPCFGCAEMSCGTEGVLICSADSVQLSYILACDAHWHDAIPRILHPNLRLFRPQLRWHSSRTVMPGHVMLPMPAPMPTSIPPTTAESAMVVMAWRLDAQARLTV